MFLRSRLLPQTRRYLSTVADANIPVIDFSPFLRARSHAEKKPTADAVVSAFKDTGFIYLKNYGIPDSMVGTVFAKNREFFELPLDAKSQLAWEDPRSNRGYVAIGRERVTQSNDAAEIAALRAEAPDTKETMEIGREWDSEWRNMWPEEDRVPGFRRAMLDFYGICHGLHVMVMRSIAIGLLLDERFFDKYVDQQCHNLRLLSYPPVSRSLLDGEGRTRAGAHSDYGTITLLFQDSIGGLEVQHPHTKMFHPAPPIPGTVVVNVGDLLARWSNDVFRSTLHRVVAPSVNTKPTEDMTPARQSIAFFCNPNFDAEISCLPGCAKSEVESKYAPIKAGDYIVGRLAATYL